MDLGPGKPRDGLFGVDFALIRQRVAGAPAQETWRISRRSATANGKKTSTGRVLLGSGLRIVTPWSLQAFDRLSKLFAC
jgi:hypothetical protein